MLLFFFFFFNATATTEIYTLSLHDALPIYPAESESCTQAAVSRLVGYGWPRQTGSAFPDYPALDPDGLEQFARSEEHTSELQSRLHLVCRLLLEKKKKKKKNK